MTDETTEPVEVTLTFKVKTSSDGVYDISILETATVMDLKFKLSGQEFAKHPADAQRLIYSGRVMKDEDMLKEYKIKEGNTIHMVKKAQSNLAQNPAAAASPSGAPRAATGVPQNMAAGTSAGNLLAGLTGARFAGHMGLPGVDTFGADGGMGAPPSEEDVASMLDNPNVQQMMNEALQNPQMIDMIIQQTPHLRNDPNARQMLQSPEFRRMMTDPGALRQAARMRSMMGNMGMGGAAGGGFPAPGVTDTTPAGAAGTAPGAAGAANPFGNLFGAGANPFGAFPPAGMTPAATPPAPGSAGQGTPGADAAAANPFASMFGGAGAGANPFGMTPEMMQQAMAAFGGGGMFGGPGTAASPPAPADTRPPEERYAEQLRQLNDMGFFDFDRNIEALRRSGGSVQGAINSLLGG